MGKTYRRKCVLSIWKPSSFTSNWGVQFRVWSRLAEFLSFIKHGILHRSVQQCLWSLHSSRLQSLITFSLTLQLECRIFCQWSTLRKASLLRRHIWLDFYRILWWLLRSYRSYSVAYIALLLCCCEFWQVSFATYWSLLMILTLYTHVREAKSVAYFKSLIFRGFFASQDLLTFGNNY